MRSSSANLAYTALGVPGAAFGTTIARFIECGLLLLFTYTTRSAAAASLAAMLGR